MDIRRFRLKHNQANADDILPHGSETFSDLRHTPSLGGKEITDIV